MRANRVPDKGKRHFGEMIVDPNHPCPFEAENDFEESFLHFMYKIYSAVENMEGVTTGEFDNPVVIQLCSIEDKLLSKLDTIIEELRLMRQ